MEKGSTVNNTKIMLKSQKMQKKQVTARKKAKINIKKEGFCIKLTNNVLRVDENTTSTKNRR